MHIKTILETEPDIARKAINLRKNPDADFPVLSAKFKLTWHCNLRCTMCNLWRPPKYTGKNTSSLNPDIVISTLTYLRTLGLRKVHFSGGEVLLLKWFPRIVSFARSLNLQVNITTNGTLITKETARFLVDERVHTVTVSIDSHDPKIHDKIRGMKGAFKQSWTGIERLQRRREKKGRGPGIGINTVINRNTIETMNKLYQSLTDNGIDSWRILPIDTEISKQRPTKEQWRNLFNHLPDWTHILTRLPMDWSSSRSCSRAEQGKYAGVFYGDNICFAPWFNLFIDADGRTYPCCTGKQDMMPFGNLNTMPVSDIMTSPVRRDLFCTMAAGHPWPICDQCDDFLEENHSLNTLYTEKGLVS